MDTLLQDTDDAELREVFNFAMSSSNNSFLNRKLDRVFNRLKCETKVNLAFGFVMKNIEDGM